MPDNPKIGETYTTSFTFNGIVTEYTLMFNGTDWVELG